MASLSGSGTQCCCELWHSSAAAAPIQPLAWEPPYAKGAALEKAKRPKKKKKIHYCLPLLVEVNNQSLTQASSPTRPWKISFPLTIILSNISTIAINLSDLNIHINEYSNTLASQCLASSPPVILSSVLPRLGITP